MKNQDNKQRLLEVMGRLDKNFKFKLNENERYSSSKQVGKITTNNRGGFDARIEKIDYDHSPRNPSLPVVNTVYNGEPTVKYGIPTLEDAINYIKSLGFNGNIKLDDKMIRTDKSIMEEFGGNTDDPTKEEMVDFLQNEFQSMDLGNTDFDIEAAIYWFGNDYHGGQSSNLYSALSTSPFRPGPTHKSIEDEESEIAMLMYNELVNKYGGSAQEDPIDADNSQWHGIGMNEDLNQPVDEFIPHGSYTVSNAGGYEVMLNDAGDAARVRDAFGSDNPQTSNWLEIEYVPNEEGNSEPVIDPNGYNIPLNMVMRINNEGSLSEVFGWSSKEKEGKANKQKIEQAKQEIQKYPPTHLFSQPGRNASEQDKKNLMTTRINMAKMEMPILAELMPQLFDFNQSFSGANVLYHGKALYGLIPTNWYHFVRGRNGFIDNNRAVEELNKELDAMGEKMGLQEEDVVEDINIDVEVGDTIMTGRFKNSPTVVKSIGKDENGMPTINGKKVVTFKKGLQEKDDKWIQKAVDPAHKGYCTPMTKDTCTPRRKALAKRFKAGIEDESIMEAIIGDNPEEYRMMVEKLKASMDNLFQEQHFDVIDTLYRLIVERRKPVVPQMTEKEEKNN